MSTPNISLLIAIFICISMGAYGQDIATLKDKKPFTVNGSVGAGSTFYTSNEEFKTRDPFTWSTYGQVNAVLYGISLPFSFNVSQYSTSFSQPFTQFGLTPSYKWIKAHLGYSHISFSPLVMDGQSFIGAGIELKPKGFYIGGFYGQLNRAVREDTSSRRFLAPQYSRKGYGIKLGVGNTKNYFNLQLFTARDDSSSITQQDTSFSLRPQQNAVAGTSFKLTLFKHIAVTTDVAVSVMNDDMAAGLIDTANELKIPSFISDMIPFTLSSRAGYSGQSQLQLFFNNFNFSAGYRRTDPHFRSLGTPYNLADMEMITSAMTLSLLKGKLSVNGNANAQRNNLSKKQSTSLQTITGNLSVNAILPKGLVIGSNLLVVELFQDHGLIKLTHAERVHQRMISGSVYPSYNFIARGNQHTASASFSYNTLVDYNSATRGQTEGDNLNASLAYSLFFPTSNWGLNLNLQHNRYDQSMNKYRSIGLNAGGNIRLLEEKNMSLQGSVGYFLNTNNNAATGNNIVFSFNANYLTQKRHSFSVYSSYVITPPVNLNPLQRLYYTVNTNNLSGGINYNYNF